MMMRMKSFKSVEEAHKCRMQAAADKLAK